MGTKPLCIRFDKVDVFIKIYRITRYSVLFGPKRYDPIYCKIRYLTSKTSGITYSFNHSFSSIRTDSNNSLPTKKTLPFNVKILMKSVFNNNKNNCYYNIFLQKGLYEKKSYAQFFLMNVGVL